MKRGLKGENYEHGRRRTNVATYTPMKRGLKDKNQLLATFARYGSNLYPDEKGTERLPNRNLMEVW